jgi:transcriptional repressor NrdR
MHEQIHYMFTYILLMHVDQVSYVRFASVYKEFKDVDQLLASMQGILDDNKRSDS